MPEGSPPAPIPFIDLDAQRRALGPALEEAVLRVVRSGRYILGPEVAELEAALARYTGAPYVVTCANGTDALALALMAWEMKPGDAVLVPAFTFAATAEVVAWLGATPVFVDVREDTFTMDPESLARGIATARRLGLVPRAVIPVDLFGQAADYAAILPLASAEGLKVLVDCAQAFGATWQGRQVAATGDMAATSFFPAKPLGCYGDGGAVFCHDRTTLEALLSLRVHGQHLEDKYENVRIGMNGRLDTIQAAILLAKLSVFDAECAARDRIAARYHAALADIAIVPRVAPGNRSVWAQYTLRVPGRNRDAILKRLRAEGIPTAIYYPKPLNRQRAYAHHPVAEGGVPVSERLSGEVFSIPFHPYLDAPTQDRIIAALRAAIADA